MNEEMNKEFGVEDLDSKKREFRKKSFWWLVVFLVVFLGAYFLTTSKTIHFDWGEEILILAISIPLSIISFFKFIENVSASRVNGNITADKNISIVPSRNQKYFLILFSLFIVIIYALMW